MDLMICSSANHLPHWGFSVGKGTPTKIRYTLVYEHTAFIDLTESKCDWQISQIKVEISYRQLELLVFSLCRGEELMTEVFSFRRTAV